jgi:hypothetical protein
MLHELVELIGVLGATLVALTTSSLLYARSLDARRDAKAKKLGAEMRAEVEAYESIERAEQDRAERTARVKAISEIRSVSPVVISPFAHIRIDCVCPKCGTITRIENRSYTLNGKEVISDRTAGIAKMPAACRDPDLCLAGDRLHLHLHCVTCDSDWFMSPKDSPETSEELKKPSSSEKSATEKEKEHG